MAKAPRRPSGPLLEDLFSGKGPQRRRGPVRTRTPEMEIIDGIDEVVVRALLPGVPPEQVEISLVGDHLTIRARPAPPEGGGEYLRRERGSTPFLTHVSLPAIIDSSRTQAHLENGILELRLAKRKTGGSHRIKVH